MLNLVIFGAPGSGKGTQSEHLTNRYGLFHISTGEVLRDHISRGTELGKIADSYISKGNLIPDELMLKVLEKTLDENPEATANGVIFDGFPRTIPQAEALGEMMKRRGTRIHSVVGLEVPEEELIKRLIHRGKESGRADDNPDTIKTRLDVYHQQTAPLRKYYTDRNTYHAVEGSGDVAKIFNDISKHIDTLDHAD
ncbi:MAG: adenylate kinase [Bacteroidales bacterium]|nr:adenylate kinase [Bacteroidales bacterium]